MKLFVAIVTAAVAVMSACKGEVNTPRSDFIPPPLTSANTWVAGPNEAHLIGQFLSRFPRERASTYREILSRTDARLEMPNDPAAQKILDAIYKARRDAQLADADAHRRGKLK